jgi:inner membrane protein
MPVAGRRSTVTSSRVTGTFAFAAVLATLALPVARGRGEAPSPPRLWTYLFLAAASHGILDAMTDGGLGIALLAPFDDTRYFFPFRPIEVSPINIRRFLSGRGLAVLASELLWVWLPSAALAGTALAWHGRRSPAEEAAIPRCSGRRG